MDKKIMNLGMEKRVAIVLGASKGIGRAIAQGLSLEGVRVIVVARSSDVLIESAKQISIASGNEVIAVPGDVCEKGLAEKLVKTAQEKWGRLDILVNNAGGPPPKGFLEADEEDWSHALQLNLMSTIRMCRAAAPVMKKQKWGRIITIGSTLMKEPAPQMVLSATARAGVTAFSKAISIELAPFGITVNSIATGGVQTDRLVSLFKTISDKGEQSLEEMLENAANNIPIGRFASPEEFSQMIIFLASEAGQYITGECISVDGGLMKSAF
jgi:3-oxoacyl-[acyl-carrier protein] reductase